MNHTRPRQLAIADAAAITIVAATAVTLIVLSLGAGPGRPAAHATARATPGETTRADTTPAGGISASDAADLARSHVMDGATFVSAAAGAYGDVFTMPPAGGVNIETPDRVVWAVAFGADFEICPPNGAPCWSPRPGHIQVILDYFTGEFLSSSAFAPA
jgi:hypothetical protein